jgi:cytochrome c-type biogenesis protein CcmH/NrfG
MLEKFYLDTTMKHRRHCSVFLWLLLLLPSFSFPADDSEKAKAYFEEGQELNKLKRHDEAIGKLREAVRLSLETHKYHQALFLTYLATRRGLQGIEVYKEMAREHPKSAAVRYWLGRFYLQSQSYDEASRAFLDATRLAPRDVHGWISLGHVYYRMGKDDEALAAYLEADRLDPHVAVVHSGLGSLYFKKGDLDRARQELEEALKTDPSLTEARYNLSLIYEKEGKIAEAAKQWQKILDEDPNESKARERLARFYFITEQYDKAVQEYTMLSQVQQNNPDVYLALGESKILWAASLKEAGGRARLMEEAAESFRQVLQFDPKNEAARRYLDRLGSKQPATGGK